MAKGSNIPVFVKEQIPESIINEAKHYLDGDAEIKIAVSSDLDPDGKLTESWLLVTDKRVMILGKNGNGLKLIQDHNLSTLKEVTCDGQVGSGFLNAVADGKHVCLARYSNGYLRKFSAVAKQLEAFSKGEEVKPDPEALPKRCPRCNFPLERDSNVCSNCVKKHQVVLRLLTYAKPHRATGFVVVFIMLFIVGLQLIPGGLVKYLIDKVLTPHNPRLLTIVVFALAGAGLLKALLERINARLQAWMGAKVSHTIRMSVCAHLEKLSVSYFDKRQTGAVMTRVSQDTAELQRFLTDDIWFFISQSLMLIGILVMMLSMNWKLGLIALVPAPVIVLMSLYVMKGLRKVYRKYWHRRSRFGAILNDSLSGVRTVKAFAQEEREAARLTKASKALAWAGAEAEVVWASLIPMFIFVMGSGTYLVWWFGGRQFLNNQISLGLIMSMLFYVGMLAQPLTIVTRFTDVMGRVFAAAERIFEVLDTPIEQPDADKSTQMPNIEGRVEFKNLTFGYMPHSPVLHDINLDVVPGEMIGLVGHSGAGKSTTINLICRFYTAQDGELLIDGVNIKDIKLSDLRSQIGVVPQEPYLFAGTIAENIAYSKPDVGIEDIIRAAKAANAHDFIVNFPDSYETQVGERGQGLSGGEKQRIAIARAILHDPKILILDEATSAIDTQTEKQIQEALARLVKNRTTFAIAHRLSTLRNANRLLVLDHGKIAEIGTHNELLKKKGTYFKLVEMQQELSRIKAVDG
jgi:ATP-binding cassette subfamily B protein